jgi:hypothetical protein
MNWLNTDEKFTAPETFPFVQAALTASPRPGRRRAGVVGKRTIVN